MSWLKKTWGWITFPIIAIIALLIGRQVGSIKGDKLEDKKKHDDLQDAIDGHEVKTAEAINKAKKIIEDNKELNKKYEEVSDVMAQVEAATTIQDSVKKMKKRGKSCVLGIIALPFLMQACDYPKHHDPQKAEERINEIKKLKNNAPIPVPPVKTSPNINPVVVLKGQVADEDMAGYPLAEHEKLNAELDNKVLLESYGETMQKRAVNDSALIGNAVDIAVNETEKSETLKKEVDKKEEEIRWEKGKGIAEGLLFKLIFLLVLI